MKRKIFKFLLVSVQERFDFWKNWNTYITFLQTLFNWPKNDWSKNDKTKGIVPQKRSTNEIYLKKFSVFWNEIETQFYRNNKTKS